MPIVPLAVTLLSGKQYLLVSNLALFVERDILRQFFLLSCKYNNNLDSALESAWVDHGKMTDPQNPPKQSLYLG